MSEENGNNGNRRLEAISDKHSEISEGRARSNANLKPFKPGQSGNPAGRPKSRTITEEIRRKLDDRVPKDRFPKDKRTAIEFLADLLVISALRGNLNSLKEIMDRVEGKPRQQVEHTGKDGGPIEISGLRHKAVEIAERFGGDPDDILFELSQALPVRQ